MLTKRRRSLVGFIILAVGLIGLSTQLLLKSKIRHWETRFSEMNTPPRFSRLSDSCSL